LFYFDSETISAAFGGLCFEGDSGTNSIPLNPPLDLMGPLQGGRKRGEGKERREKERKGRDGRKHIRNKSPVTVLI